MEFIVYKSGSSGNLYELEDRKSRILLECGLAPTQASKVLNYHPGEYAGLLLTHEHMDHARAAGYFVSIGVPVYTSLGTAAALELPDYPNVHLIKDGDRFTIGSFEVLALRAFHDGDEPLMFVIHSTADDETMLFATDTGYLRHPVGKMDIIAVECNYSEGFLDEDKDLPDVVISRIRRTHLSVERLLEYLDACDLSGCRDICLLHLSSRHANSKLFLSAVQQKTGIPVRIK